MKKFIFVLLASALLSFNASAETSQPKSQYQEQSTPSKCEELKKSGMSDEQLAQSGCCSWHKGVCGCSNGRVKCCDGSLSPSCTCNKPFDGETEI